jgi:hypothetical protein
VWGGAALLVDVVISSSFVVMSVPIEKAWEAHGKIKPIVDVDIDEMEEIVSGGVEVEEKPLCGNIKCRRVW